MIRCRRCGKHLVQPDDGFNFICPTCPSDEGGKATVKEGKDGGRPQIIVDGKDILEEGA